MEQASATPAAGPAGPDRPQAPPALPVQAGRPHRHPRGARDWERVALAEVSAGLITALFSVPEGMAYAAIAGFDPVTGLSAGMLPAVLGSLLARTALMVTTLTSAIALTSRAAFQQAHLDPAVPGNVAALTLLVALAMAGFAVLRLDVLLRLVSPGAMAGFSVGIAVQIIAGALEDATGYRAHQGNRLLRIVSWAAHAGSWTPVIAAVAAATAAVWVLAHAGRRTGALAVLIALVTVSAGVAVCGLRVPLAGALGAIPAGLPVLSRPAWGALARLAPGACAVALVALAQAAGIPGATPGAAPAVTPGAAPGAGGRRRWGDDVLAQAVANLVGAFCHALPVGGSLSRTGVAVAAGARGRWAGVVSGLVLAALVSTLGGAVARIPLPVIGALLIIVGVKLIHGRLPAVLATWRSGPPDTAIMLLTLLATTQLPLQYALAAGLALSLLHRSVGALRAGAARRR